MLRTNGQNLLQAAIITAALSVTASAAGQPTKGAILQRLEARYVPTQTNDDKSDITTAGSILTLKKDNLITVGMSSGSICPNTYKDGRITQGKLAALTCGRAMSAAGQAKRKVFLDGQKLWVTSIEVKDGGVVFGLYTDAYEGERFVATLTFPFAKGSLPTPEEVEGVVAEVFSTDSPVEPTSAEQKPVPPAGGSINPRQEAPPPIAPPPPPPAEPKTINVGMTIEQVLANFGQPEKIVKLGAKQVYVYKDLKVTFVNNKVTDVK